MNVIISKMATIGKQFTFTVYSRRWGHTDTYRITLIKTGWHVAYVSIQGDCTPNGEPFLQKNLRQDSIQHPASLGDAMEWLFNEHPELTDEELQEGLNQVAEWVSITEKATPTGGVFAGCFG